MTERRVRRKKEEPEKTPGTRIDIAAPGAIDIAKDHLGAVLNARRLALGLRLDDVAEDIKIRANYLRALEEESFDDLPTPEYARLFLKSYAERLGLDGSEIYALLDLCEFPHTQPIREELGRDTQPVRAPITARSSGLPMGWIIAAGVILIAVVIWSVINKGKGGTETGALPAEQDVVLQSGFTVPEPEITQPAIATVDTMRLQLTFDRDTWVVLAADDDTVVNRILHAGDQAEANAISRFLLTLGHTDGVQATVNGQPLSPFRARASRFTGLTITRDSVAAWRDTTTVNPDNDPNGTTEDESPTSELSETTI